MASILSPPLDYSHVHFQGVPAPARETRSRGSPFVRDVVKPLCPTPPVQVSPEESQFLAWLFDRAGLDRSAYRATPLHRRIPACLRALRAANVPHARRLVESSPALLAKALDAVLIGVSEFFRDERVFAVIRDHVLPCLAAEPGPLRIWSIGCSGGEEVYSVALLAAELGLLPRCELKGSDCRVSALGGAAAGRYSGAKLTAITPAVRQEFVRQMQTAIEIAPAIRGRVRWEVRDVTRTPPGGTWDLVLCRNVAMYLEAARADLLWQQLVDVVRPGGFLVAGRAEQPTTAGWTREAACVYRREHCGT